MKKLLVIGHTFPEPTTTAAGTRMMELLGLFLEEDYQITFASTASISEKSANLENLQITVKSILLNDSSFDSFVKDLDPTMVIFDRYITEEQFGWRISEQCPNALKILDTEDLHFLRKAREVAVKNNLSIEEVNLYSDTAKREIASILRCDLSLIISEYEMKLLQEVFKIPSEILYYLPFLIEEEIMSLPSFQERHHFITVGNLFHAPNVDSVLQLKLLWPSIKKQLPKAELHIYGNYAPQQISELHNLKQGFLIKGWAKDVSEVMKNSRVQLAPIRFGAGLKGKLIDAMRFGTPSVTTSVGAESINAIFPFAGRIEDNSDKFIEAAIELYQNESEWKSAQNNGFEIIENRFRKDLFSEDFKMKVQELSTNLKMHREQNFIGQILLHHSLQASKYLSKWIEAKNQPASPVCYANSDEVRDDYKEQ